jgi:hypothetical protein
MTTPDPNPYAAPQASLATATPGALAEGACPRCQSPNVKRPTFTWWGGALGPKLLSHAVCSACGFGFNWKTGKSNGKGIAIYMGVVLTISVVILALVAANKR